MRNAVSLPSAPLATSAPRAKWLFLLVAQCGFLIALAFMAKGALREQLLATGALAIFQCLAIVWVLRDDDFNRLNYFQIFVAAGVICAAGIAVNPLLEDDHFRFLWDGYITATTLQPYQFPPAYFFGATHVPEVMQAALSGVNHPDIPSVYGPALQALFALSYAISPGALWPLKVFLALGLLLTLLALAQARVAPRWAMVFALHPLVIKESVVSAHLDVLIGCALLWAVLAWQRQRYGVAATVVSLAVAMKLSCLVALPFFFIDQRGRFNKKAFAASIATLGALYAPLFFSAQSEAAALSTFGESWLFNPLFFKWIAAASGGKLARGIVAFIYITLWVGIAIAWHRRLRDESAASVSPPVVAALASLVLLSPVVNPWYWLWVLPLMLTQVLQRSAALALTVALIAYSHAIEGVPNRFEVPAWATALQIAVVACFLIAWMMQRNLIATSIATLQRYRRITVVLSLAIVGGTLLSLTPPYTPSWVQIDGWIGLRYPSVKAISTQGLTALSAAETVIILDVRTEAEYAVSHIPAAQFVPLHALNAYAQRTLAHTPRDAPIVVYCAVGVRSAQAAQTLAQLGFTRVHNLQGAIFKWAIEGRALVGGDTVHGYDARFNKLLPPSLRAL